MLDTALHRGAPAMIFPIEELHAAPERVLDLFDRLAEPACRRPLDKLDRAAGAPPAHVDASQTRKMGAA